MYWAVEKGNVAMVKLLLSANPDLEISTKVICLRPKHVVGSNWIYIYIYNKHTHYLNVLTEYVFVYILGTDDYMLSWQLIASVYLVMSGGTVRCELYCRSSQILTG